MNSISELTQLSQTQYQPQMSGIGAGVGNLGQGQIRQKQTFNLGNTNADKLAKELANMVGSVQDFTEKQIQFSDDAIKRVAIDHTLSLEEEITAIDADPELSFDEKRKRIGDATNKLYTASGKIISDEPRSQQIYDDIFTNKARGMINKSMAKIDIEENKQFLANELGYAQEALQQSKNIKKSELELILSGNIKQKTISQAQIDKMFYDSKKTFVFNDIAQKPEEYFGPDGKLLVDDIKEKFEDVKDSEVLMADLGEALKKEQDSMDTKMWTAQGKFNSAYTDKTYDRYLNSDGSIQSIKKIIEDIKIDMNRETVDYKDLKVDGSTAKTLITSLQATVKSIEGDINANVKKRLLSTIKGAKESYKINEENYSDFLDYDPNTGMFIDKKSDTYSRTIQAIENAYADNPEEIDNQINEVNKLHRKAIEVSNEVTKTPLNEPDPVDTSKEAKQIRTAIRNRQIEFYMNNGDYSNATMFMEAGKEIPSSIVNRISQLANSEDNENRMKAMEMIQGMSSNNTVRSLLSTGSDTKNLYAFLTVASKNGITDSELETFNKISTNDLDYTKVGTRARLLVDKMDLDENHPQRDSLLQEASYFFALGLNDEEVTEYVEAIKDGKMYNSSKNDTEVFNAPKWATEDVVDKSIDILYDVMPTLKENGTYVQGDDDGNMLVYSGTGDKRIIIGMFNQEDYLSMLGEYRQAGKDEDYQRQLSSDEQRRNRIMVMNLEREGKFDEADKLAIESNIEYKEQDSRQKEIANRYNNAPELLTPNERRWIEDMKKTSKTRKKLIELGIKLEEGK